MYRFLLGITDFPHNGDFYLKAKKSFQKEGCLFGFFNQIFKEHLINSKITFIYCAAQTVYVQVVQFAHLLFYMTLCGQFSCQIVSESERFCCNSLSTLQHCGSLSLQPVVDASRGQVEPGDLQSLSRNLLMMLLYLH